MKMQLQLGATLLLALGWIFGNASVAFAHGGGEGGAVAMTGYIMYVGFILVGYFTMVYEIPQRLTGLLFGSSDKKSESSKPSGRTPAQMK